MGGNGAELSLDGEKEGRSSKFNVKVPLSPQLDAEGNAEVDVKTTGEVGKAMTVVAGPVTVTIVVPVMH